MADKLTLKQQKFIDYYIELGNATEAAIKAGYSVKTANEIGAQNLVKLSSHIKEKMNSKQDDRIATQDEVLRLITQFARGEIKEEVIVVESIGDYQSEAKVIEKRIVPKDQLKALEMLSKRFGIDKPEGEIENQLEKVDSILVSIRKIATQEDNANATVD